MSLNADEAKVQMNEAVNHLKEQLKKLRTGRANASMLDAVSVEVYGQQSPLNHIATINVVDAQMIQISPFDPNNLEAISAAIRDDQSLGLNPADDGQVVRLQIPPMTTERRHEVVKQLNERVEETKVSLRNTRHEVLKTAKQQWKDNELGEDDYKKVENDMNDMVDDFQKQIDELAKAKETEIMTV